jgi:hypothetical protein
LIKQAAKTGTIILFRPRRWRRLMPVLVLLLLFTNQTWADSLCFCDSDGDVSRSGCHTTHFPDQKTLAMPEDAAPQSTHHCSDAESSIAAAQPAQLTHSNMICFRLQPDVEAEAIPVTTQTHGPNVATLPFIYFGAQSNSAPLPDNFHHPHQKLSLYLSYSCLLI